MRLPAPTFLDRAVAYLSPEAGMRRLHARARMELLSGPFKGADSNRQAMRGWSTFSGSPDDVALLSLPQLRTNARDLSRNEPIARGAVNTVVRNVVGTGLWPKPMLDRKFLGLTEVEAERWEEQAERIWTSAWRTLDYERKEDFAGLQALAFRAELDGGDVFAVRRYVMRRGDVIGTKLQLVEAERVSNPSQALDRPGLMGGVESVDGVPVAYHILNQYPNQLIGSEPQKWTKVPAWGPESGLPHVLHCFLQDRPGQTRGLPYLAAVIEPLKQLGRYSEAELMAAVVSGMFTVFIKTEDGEDALQGIVEERSPAEGSVSVTSSMEPTEERVLKMGHGLVVGLGAKDEIETANPGRPNTAFDPFVQAILRQVGVALEIPFEILVAHFTSSYSAARAALLAAWQFFRTRRARYAVKFCQPTYEMVITEAISLGMLAAPGFFSSPLIRQAYLEAIWVGDSPGQIDPLKETQAAKLRMETRLSTLAEETIGLTGGDWRRNLAQASREQKTIEELGLTTTAPTAPAAEPPKREEEED